MDTYGIADIYKAANLTLSPEAMKLRQAPHDAIAKSLTLSQASELSRLYFGLKGRPIGDWFVKPFNDADGTFSMYDNEREAAVLAASILAASTKRKEANALAPLSASMAGSRKPIVSTDLLALFEKRLAEKAIESREPKEVDLKGLAGPWASKAGADASTALQAQDWPNAGKAVKAISDDAQAATTALAKGSTAAATVLSNEVKTLREEIDMLWWFIGGVSETTKEVFSELSAGTAAILAGCDIADLANSLVGPYAVPAILVRTLQNGRKGKLPKVSLAEAVEGVRVEELLQNVKAATLAEFSDVCPIHCALTKFAEVGNGWGGAYQKITGLKPDVKIEPALLSLQAYRERQLLAGLG